MEQYYELWSDMMVAGEDLAFWQTFFVKFYQAFIEADRWKQYLEGVGTTLLVTAMALAMGVALGIIVAIIRTAHDQQRPGNKNFLLGIVDRICRIYVTVIRGTPMMVQLLIMGMVIFSSSRNFTMIGAVTLGINSGAYVAEIIRGGLMAVDPGQMEAGRSLGLSYWQTMLHIVLPQALKSTLPSLCNEGIALLKETSIAGYIGLGELTRGAMQITSQTFDYFPPLLAIAAIYLIVVVVLTKLVNILERRLAQSDR